MNKDILQIRLVMFCILLVVAGVFLFPQVAGNRVVLLDTILLVISAAALVTWVLEFLLRYVIRRSVPLEGQRSSQSNSAILIEATRKLIAAQTTQDIIQLLMRSGCTITSADGASFVSFDGWGGSFPQLVHGSIPESVLQSWSDRLISPETRQSCQICQTRSAGSECVLLRGTLSVNSRVFCQPVRDGEREIGAINFFLGPGTFIGENQHLLLDELSEISSMAIEAVRRRDKEIAALRHLQSSTTSQELPELLTGLILNLGEALDVKSALLWIPDGLRGGLSTPMLIPTSLGTTANSRELLDLPSIRGIWQTVQASRQTISMQNISLDEKKVWKYLLAVPLAWREEEPVGLLLLGGDRSVDLSERRLLLIQNVAGQAALLVQNARLMIQVEYQAVVDERTRLAREIHDGLAQTLAFLKIQSAQMRGYLQQGKLDRLESTLEASHRTLSEAYLDARLAIDNLRSLPESSTQDWISRVAMDFEQTANIPVDISGLDLKFDFPLTIQAQLIRIIQEALGNVRKHADASKVIIRGYIQNDETILEVCDNGVGFDPDQISIISRYGLLGMRERADIIGADFQIESKPGNGTIIRLCLPVQSWQESV
jgi:two-component system, NarL family, nitrate/nitrite sensor histidine kinase NarX